MRDTWSRVLEHLSGEIDPEDVRRWFGATAQASDAGDQITVWVPSESIGRHIRTHYVEAIDRALTALDRPHAHIRFVVAGYGEDDDLE